MIYHHSHVSCSEVSVSLNYQQMAINDLSLTYISDYSCMQHGRDKILYMYHCPSRHKANKILQKWLFTYGGNLHELNVVSLKTAYFKYMVKKIKALLSKVNHTSRYSKIFTGIV